MKKFNILDFIDSEDISEHNKDTIFLPTQKAILISRSQRQSIENKIKAMESLLLEHMDWDFPYISDTDNSIYLILIIEEYHSEKQLLRDLRSGKRFLRCVMIIKTLFIFPD